MVRTRGKIFKAFLEFWKKLCCSKSNKTISCSEKEITDKKEINTELFKFYKARLEPKINVSNALIPDDLNRIKISKLSKEHTAQKMKFSINDLFSKCWSHLLKKSLMENFIICAVSNRKKMWRENYWKGTFVSFEKNA